MRVNLIDHTGIGAADPSQYAARLLCYVKATRLEQGKQTRHTYFVTKPWKEIEKELAAVANTIRSSWEFVDFTFEILDVSRAYTHQQVRSRVGVSFAQQAQRVASMGDFSVLKPETIASNEGLSTRFDHLMKLTSIFYKEAQEAGVPNQDCRSVLPTNVLTNIIMKINLRAFAELVGKRENLRAQGEYADVVRECARLVMETMPWTKMFLYPERTSTPYLDKLMKEVLGDNAPVDDPDINEALKEIDKMKGTWG
jgi:flavin-dependent thymidylate synthase